MTQRWEYKTEFRRRETGFDNRREPYLTDWDNKIPDKLPALGDEGWELVAISPRATSIGDATGGITTEKLWVFKRPKP